MQPGSIVVVYLVNPAEKYWGRLESLAAPGITLRGLHLSSFDDWIEALAGGEEPTLGLSTVFFPLLRVERMFLDEPMAGVESLAQRFERRVGRKLDDFLS